MQTITTKYLGATDFNGERISVNIDGQRKYIPYNYALNTFDNHAKAVIKAMMELGKSHGQQFDAHRAIKQVGHINGDVGLIVEY